MSKMVVGIAMGGYSSERAISLESGDTVFQNLSKEKWDCYKLLIDQNQWVVVDRNNRSFPFDPNDFSFSCDQQTISIDVVFNAVHGDPGENGQLAGLFQLQNIPHTSCESSVAELTFDKRRCLEIVKKMGIPTAKSIAFDKGDELSPDSIADVVGLPCFVKPNRSGSSYGIAKVYEKKDLTDAIQAALKEDSQLIIESALEGMEISVGVYSHNEKIIVLPATEIISENDFFDYEAKYLGKSQEITPARLDEFTIDKVAKISEELYKKLNLKGVCRSEFILVDKIPHLLEVNTIPGLTAASLIPQQLGVAGIELNVFFDQLLEEALKKNI